VIILSLLAASIRRSDTGDLRISLSIQEIAMAHLASRVESSSPSPTFLLGQNRRGQWVVRQVCGLIEGLFVDRKQAIRFALFESGSRPGAVIATPVPLEMESLR
jgi:hypothetical protein